jgi:hypothetical protein
VFSSVLLDFKRLSTRGFCGIANDLIRCDVYIGMSVKKRQTIQLLCTLVDLKYVLRLLRKEKERSADINMYTTTCAWQFRLYNCI